MACQELRRGVAHCQCRQLLTFEITREEVVRTQGGPVSSVQLRLHLVHVEGATWMLVVALTAGHTTRTPRGIWDVCQAVDTESLRGHALRALPCSRCPSFFHLLVVGPRNPVNGHSEVDFLSGASSRRRVANRRYSGTRDTEVARRARAAVYSKESLTRGQSIARVLHTGAYGLYESCIRSLRQRGTTLVKEIVLLLWDPIAQ